MTANEAAAYLGMSGRGMRKACKKLEVPKNGRDYLILANDLERIVKQRARVGRKRKPE